MAELEAHMNTLPVDVAASFYATHSDRIRQTRKSRANGEPRQETKLPSYPFSK